MCMPGTSHVPQRLRKQVSVSGRYQDHDRNHSLRVSDPSQKTNELVRGMEVLCADYRSELIAAELPRQ